MSLETLIRNLGFFHDGSLDSINHFEDNIDLVISSAELEPEELRADIALSSENTIDGILHLIGVKKIKINDSFLQGRLRMMHDDGEILHLDITDSLVKIDVIWCNYPPKDYTDDFSVIEIEFESLSWENAEEKK